MNRRNFLSSIESWVLIRYDALIRRLVLKHIDSVLSAAYTSKLIRSEAWHILDDALKNTPTRTLEDRMALGRAVRGDRFYE